MEELVVVEEEEEEEQPKDRPGGNLSPTFLPSALRGEECSFAGWGIINRYPLSPGGRQRWRRTLNHAVLLGPSMVSAWEGSGEGIGVTVSFFQGLRCLSSRLSLLTSLYLVECLLFSSVLFSGATVCFWVL